MSEHTPEMRAAMRMDVEYSQPVTPQLERIAAIIAEETAAERDRLREALEGLLPAETGHHGGPLAHIEFHYEDGSIDSHGYEPVAKARAALDGTAPSEAEKLRALNGELVKALARLANPEAFDIPQTIDGKLAKELRMRMEFAEAALAKARENQP